MPGIAGMVFTIGMAVDANVLIFERIREELQKNKSSKLDQGGYERAFSSIFDSNLTTLITSFSYTFGMVQSRDSQSPWHSVSSLPCSPQSS